MENPQEAKLDMYRSVTTLLASATAAPIIVAATAIAATRQDLADIIASIEGFDLERETEATGDGDNKKGLRRLALSAAIVVNGMITGFAARNKDATLLAQFNHEKSDYAKE